MSALQQHYDRARIISEVKNLINMLQMLVPQFRVVPGYPIEELGNAELVDLYAQLASLAEHIPAVQLYRPDEILLILSATPETTFRFNREDLGRVEVEYRATEADVKLYPSSSVEREVKEILKKYGIDEPRFNSRVGVLGITLRAPDFTPKSWPILVYEYGKDFVNLWDVSVDAAREVKELALRLLSPYLDLFKSMLQRSHSIFKKHFELL